MVRRRPSMGRQKIEIKKIENEEARQVCFSKRRTGLFKKASELSILCGAELAVVVFSPAGKVFSFGHPSVEAVVDRFLGEPKQGRGAAPLPTPLQAGFRDLNRQYTELSNKLEAEKKKREAAEKALKAQQQQQQHYWRDVDIEETLGLAELEAFRVSVEQLKCGVARRAEKLLLEAAAATSRMPPPAPPLQLAATVNFAQFAAGSDPFHHLPEKKGGGVVFGRSADALGLRRGVY